MHWRSSISMRFNPRPRAGANIRNVEVAKVLKVSIHAPARGRTDTAERATGDTMFQSTPPRGGEHSALTRAAWGRCFNPRPRAGANARPLTASLRHGLFQSTPPRGGEPNSRRGRVTNPAVSIHAPARGRTDRGYGRARHLRVSIHAPARGRTAGSTPKRSNGRFQSTPPRGGERRSSGAKARRTSFNPRPRAGANVMMGGPDGAAQCFNPRPRAGANVTGVHRLPRVTGFNPRPRAGANTFPKEASHVQNVSIHAPARGRTRQVLVNIEQHFMVSIHAPARGRT